MSLLRRIFHLFLALSFMVSSAWAEVPEELQNLVLTGDLNARSSVDFRSNAKNVTGLVPKGTKGTVLEVRKLKKTGSYGIRMKVNQVGNSTGKNVVQKDQEIWVYYSQRNPWLKFRDPDNQTVQDPEEALTAQAKRDGESLPAIEGTVKSPTLPTREEILKASVDPNLAMKDRTVTEGTWCTTGTCLNQPSPIHNTQNIEQVEEVLRAMPEKTTPKPAAIPAAALAPPANPNDPWADDPYIKRMSDASQKMINHALANKRGRSQGECWKYVKRSCLATKKCSSYPWGGSARNAVQALLDQNKNGQKWVNLLDNPKYKNKIKSPADVPKGAIMVTWTGERNEHGDVSIKTGSGTNNAWVSDFASPRPIMEQSKGRRKARQGKPYKIIGVMMNEKN